MSLHLHLLQPHLATSQHQRPPPRCVAAAASKKQQQKPKRRKPKQQQPISQRISYIEEEYEDEFEAPRSGPAADIRLVPGTRVPKAPAPKSAPASAEVAPEDLYPVFPKPPKAVERLPGSSKWSWDDETSGAGQQRQQQGGAAAERLWNPKTGFMRTRAELEQEQAAAAAAAVASSQPQPGATQAATQPVASNSSSSSSSSSSGVVERLQDVPNPLQAPQLPRSALANSAAAAAAGQQQPASGELPAVCRGQVLTSCALTAAAMAGAAVGLSVLVAPRSAALLGTSQQAVDRLLQLPPGLQDVQQLGVMLGAAAAVTAARFALQQQWPEFREASDRSNQQVLTSLGWPDVVLVALLSGVSEELLFRWALIGCTWPDARGVLLSGAVFGVLHMSGGRNAAFAAWASAVGCLYGAAFLATGNVWVPAGAHAIANFASAAAWISNNRQK